MKGPYTVEVFFDGTLCVCDAQGDQVASFIPDLRELAEETRDRLNIRDLATGGVT